MFFIHLVRENLFFFIQKAEYEGTGSKPRRKELFTVLIGLSKYYRTAFVTVPNPDFKGERMFQQLTYCYFLFVNIIALYYKSVFTAKYIKKKFLLALSHSLFSMAGSWIRFLSLWPLNTLQNYHPFKLTVQHFINPKHQFILLGLFVINQQKEEHNCEVEEKNIHKKILFTLIQMK